MESLSLIDAVMPDVVASRQQLLQNNQKPQVVKTEPPNSNGDEPMHSYCKYFSIISTRSNLIVRLSSKPIQPKGEKRKPGWKSPPVKPRSCGATNRKCSSAPGTPRPISWHRDPGTARQEYGTWTTIRPRPPSWCCATAFRKAARRCPATRTSPHWIGT